MSDVTSKFARIEMAKARLRLAISAYTNELAMVEILAAGGGAMKAIDLADKLKRHFDDTEKDPHILCKSMGFAPDEVVDIARFLP